MINFDNITKENNKNIIQTGVKFLIPYIILIKGGPRSTKVNTFFNLIKRQVNPNYKCYQ